MRLVDPTLSAPAPSCARSTTQVAAGMRLAALAGEGQCSSLLFGDTAWKVSQVGCVCSRAQEAGCISRQTP